MASNTIPFPHPAGSPPPPGRESIFSQWRRRTLRAPAGFEMFNFPLATALPAPSRSPALPRLYLVSSQTFSSETARANAHDRFAQARSIARQVEREIAEQAARQRSIHSAPKPPASAPATAEATTRPGRETRRENRLLQVLRSLAKIA